MRAETGDLLRIHSAGRASVDAFVEDYAAVADGMISLYEATGDEYWYSEVTIDDRRHESSASGITRAAASSPSAATANNSSPSASRPRTAPHRAATPWPPAPSRRMYALTADGRYADLIEAMRTTFSLLR